MEDKIKQELREMNGEYNWMREVGLLINPTKFIAYLLGSGRLPSRPACELFLSQYIEPSAASLWLSQIKWDGQVGDIDEGASDQIQLFRENVRIRFEEFVKQLVPAEMVDAWCQEFVERCRDGLVEKVGDLFAQMAITTLETMQNVAGQNGA